MHDLPDYVYFNHEIHVNKGIGCASCHGRVDEMPLMYQQNTLQMEWCLNCHRNPAVNLRPTSEIYNMAWAGPSTRQAGVVRERRARAEPTAQNVSCTTTDPTGSGPEVAMLRGRVLRCRARRRTADEGPLIGVMMPASYQKFTSQMELGKYLTAQYHIRTAE